MMQDCIFCKIANGEIGSKTIYEDDDLRAFYDLNPEAPVHFLVIPKTHITSVQDIDSENSLIVAKVYTAIAKIAKELNLDKGYRVVTNVGEDGGQSVAHLHFHVLAGRSLQWPPG